MANRKLGRPTDQRMALLRNQVTNLIWYGRIETTLTRAKEVRSLAERLITCLLYTSGPTLKRYWARSHGRADLIKKHTSHITIVLDQKN